MVVVIEVKARVSLAAHPERIFLRVIISLSTGSPSARNHRLPTPSSAACPRFDLTVDVVVPGDVMV